MEKWEPSPMNILSIDPGPTHSAWVLLVDGFPDESGWEDNESVVELVTMQQEKGADSLVIEKITSYGMGVGESVFETVYWSGIFAHAFGIDDTYRITRSDVTKSLSVKGAPKAAVNQAIRDSYDTLNAVGTKKNPGVLYDFAKNGPTGGNPHRYDALAAGLAFIKENY